MGGEDAGVTAGRGADVEVELHVVLQPVAVLVASGEDALLLLLFVVATGHRSKGRCKSALKWKVGAGIPYALGLVWKHVSQVCILFY